MPPAPRRRAAVRRLRVAGRHSSDTRPAPGPRTVEDRSAGDVAAAPAVESSDVESPAAESPAAVESPAAESPAAVESPADPVAEPSADPVAEPSADPVAEPSADPAGDDPEPEPAAAPVRPRGRASRTTRSRPVPRPEAQPRAAPERAETGSEQGTGSPRSAVATLVALVMVLVLAGALTAYFLEKSRSLTESPAAQNEALVDVGATAQVVGQVRDALETLYTYDHARLDDNEAATRQVITEGFVPDFEQQFAEVRELAPAQQAVVTATVPNIAVRILQDDRAVLFAFIDQQADRGADGQQVLSAGRMTVTAERVEGPDGQTRWKIADVVPR